MGGASQNTRFSTLGEKATADAVQIPVIVLCVINTDDTTFVLRRAVALLNPAAQETPPRCWWSCVEGRLHPATQIAPPLRHEHGQSIHGGQCETRRHGPFT